MPDVTVLEVPKKLYNYPSMLRNNLGLFYSLSQTKEDLERALKGKFVTCKVQYRDKKTDAIICNVFVQRPPE